MLLKKNAFLVLIWMLFSVSLWADTPLAKAGVLDLSTWDFETNAPISLQGEWAFYWNQLTAPEANSTITPSFIEVPSFWHQADGLSLSSKGYATYHLKILLPDDLPAMAIQMPYTFSAYKLWINGELIAQNGKVGTSKATSTPYWLPITKTVTLDNEVDITLQISNFHSSHGGIHLPIYMGVSEAIVKQERTNIGVELLVVGSLLMGGLFCMGLFFFGHRDTPILYFAVFCILQSYSELSEELFYIPKYLDLNWQWFIRLERLASFVAIIALMEYAIHLFPKDKSRLITRIIEFTVLGFILYVFIFPGNYFINFIIITISILGIFAPYFFYLLVRAVVKKRKGAIYVLYSLISILLVLGFSLYANLNNVGENPLINFIGISAFVFFNILALSNRFSARLNEAVAIAQESERSKTEFLATMSHEIRTPLNGVIGMTQLLDKTSLSDEQRRFTDIIRVSGENLITIVDDILDFSKITEGKVTLESLPFSPEQLIEETIDLFSEKANQEGLQLLSQANSDVPAELLGDATRIKQILINLVGNAIKFTPKGSVSIEMQLVEHSEDQARLQINVKDTGIGISEEQQERLFKYFAQADASISRKYGGSGLGLAISRNLVNLMNGEIWAESTVGEGTTFSFTILLDHVQHNVPIVRKIPSLADTRVLVLSASPSFITMIEKFGKEQQLTLNIITKPIIPAKKQFDLVILDSYIQDGEHLLEELEEGQNCPIIYFTPLTAMQKKEFSAQVKAIYNPLKFSILRETLKTLDQYTPIVPKVTVKETSSQDSQVSKKLEILVVEDHPINQKLVMMLLKKNGYTADLAENGVQALEALEKKQYDLIFMDIQMPEMDGLTATKEIRKRYNKQQVIIAMTANAMQGDREECLSAGMDDYASKPLKPGIIKEMIQKWMKKEAIVE